MKCLFTILTICFISLHCFGQEEVYVYAEEDRDGNLNLYPQLGITYGFTPIEVHLKNNGEELSCIIYDWDNKAKSYVVEKEFSCTLFQNNDLDVYIEKGTSFPDVISLSKDRKFLFKDYAFVDSRDSNGKVKKLKYTDNSNSLTSYILTEKKVKKQSFTNPKTNVKTFTVNGVSFEMIQVEGDIYQMGSADLYHAVHLVKLNNFYIGKFEVSQALWKAVMGKNPSYNKGDNLPVESVSWKKCQEFITKLNTLTGMNFRLPTEAEWEFAARGGKYSQKFKYSGSNHLDEVAWYNKNSGNNLHNVGSKKPNELGIYDMSGNVFELCSDWYNLRYDQRYQENPRGPETGKERVARGGCYMLDERRCHSSERHSFSSKSCLIGFRLALSE